jgi:hypothetical protein
MKKSDVENGMEFFGKRYAKPAESVLKRNEKRTG